MSLVVGYGVVHIARSYRHICHAIARVAFVSDKSAGDLSADVFQELLILVSDSIC
jgi:hypothetical protein